MAEPSKGFKMGSVITSSLLAIGIIALAGTMLLPSTKRARVDWKELERMRLQYEQEAPATMPATTRSSTTSPTTASQPASTGE